MTVKNTLNIEACEGVTKFGKGKGNIIEEEILHKMSLMILMNI